MNGEPQQPEAAEQSSAASPAVALATDILQGALILCVVGWVLDLPRRLFDMSFYTEQLLAVCLGLGLALSFITTSTAIGSRIRIMRWLDWFAAVASLIICGYIAYRYDALTYEIALLPIDGYLLSPPTCHPHWQQLGALAAKSRLPRLTWQLRRLPSRPKES